MKQKELKETEPRGMKQEDYNEKGHGLTGGTPLLTGLMMTRQTGT